MRYNSDAFALVIYEYTNYESSSFNLLEIASISI